MKRPDFRVRLHVALTGIALACGAAHPLAAQRPAVEPIASSVQLAGEAEERLRLDQLFSGANAPAYLIRSMSSLSRAGGDSRRIAIALFAPELRLVNNSALPFSMNDGPLWAGRGTNTLITAGVGLRWKRLRAIVAPQYTSSENLGFQVIPYPQESPGARNQWANAFHPMPSSIDLPFRFGDASLTRIDAGQSSIAVDLPRATVGVATENVWWGPGARNAIVLSSNAGGFPHAFAQTSGDLRTRVGRFDAQWILGSLRESDFFDGDSANDTRSLSGVVVVWTPRADSGLSFGLARTVFAKTGNSTVLPLGQALDVLRDVGAPNSDTSSSAPTTGYDQVFSVFGRWVLPRAGFETYFEWARFEQPASLRDLLEYPQHSQGYTLGLQWARPVVFRGRDSRFRLQAEATYLEPDPAQRVRPVGTTYTSRAVPQGYTHRGQSLGAAIGPGSSSQWVTADVFGAAFRVGAFAERIRWDNATVWEPIIPEAKAEDVSLIGGLRGSVVWRGARIGLEYAHAVRLDYLYQDRVPKPDGKHAGVDIVNNTISLTISSSAQTPARPSPRP